jgi:Zn-dependent M28 family amino/carboxypeptidase
MLFRTFASISALALAMGSAAAQTEPKPIAEVNARINAPLPEDQAAMKSHVMFLASDAMGGRNAGSHEYDIAAQYVSAQFYAQGLRPAGDDGSYLQKVPLQTYKPAGEGSFVINAKTGPVTLAYGQDYLPGVNPNKLENSAATEIVFVGYGITAPHLGRDDYKGANVKGKIVAVLPGSPTHWQPEERAHLAYGPTKARNALEHGAMGYILIESPKTRNFAALVKGWNTPKYTWVGKDGASFLPGNGAPLFGAISLAGAAKLFGERWAAVEKSAAAPGNGDVKFKPMTSAPVALANKTETASVTSYNVAGLLPGSDPALKDEVVVLSAHLDHVVGPPAPNGDAIYNGAMDNAVGIASLIEEAKRFKASGKPPRRSILFLAVTAEEKGLLGAEYFAHYPSIFAKEKLVGNVNLDMPLLNYTFQDVVVFGALRSTLGPIVERATKGIGVTIAPDPLPEEGLFVRSDHYRFVQQGIPSVFLWPGPGGEGKARLDAFLKDTYHSPRDEIAQDPPIDWASGVRFVEVNYSIAREIADGDQRPLWNKGDFFGTLYKGATLP